MAKRNIVKEGDPVLKKKCRPVEKFDEKLATLLDDMCETMIDADGLGLAGPQVGILRRVFVVAEEDSLPPRSATEEELAELDLEPVFVEFVNPEIIETEGEEMGYEGCLSYPGQFGAIPRPKRAVVRAKDRYGNEFTYEAEGLMARCVCHENDHLDGITIDDLAEYFYDPEEPHELDKTLLGGDDVADEAAADTEKAAGGDAAEEKSGKPKG